MIIEVKTFEEFSKYSQYGRVLVDFFATWCGPCKMLMPVIEEMEEEGLFDEVKVLEVDVDRLGEVAARFDIQAVPTLIYMEEGDEKKRSLGYQNKNQLINFISK